MDPLPPEQLPLPAEATSPPEPRLLTRAAPADQIEPEAGEWGSRLRRPRERAGHLAQREPAQLRVRVRRGAGGRCLRGGRQLRALILVLDIVLIVAGLGAIVASLWLRHAMRASLPQIDGTLSVAGLSAPVTVTRDPQGVPLLRASSLDDLLFAQGFVTAQDRLWQMDVIRRHASGELAEILGRDLVDHDRRQRYLQIRAAADRAIAVLPPVQFHELDVYARGVNAFIDSSNGTAGAPDHLPVEFHALHYTPRPWSPRDSMLVALAMSEDLATEFPQKLNREELSAYLPANLLADLYPVGSWRDRPPSQAAPDLTSPQPEILQIPLDHSQTRNRSPLELPQTQPGPQEEPGQPLANFAALGSNTGCDGCRSGSNNWAVAGSRSASGAPLLSNDMHLSLSVPGLWYEAGLHVESPASGQAGPTAAGVTPAAGAATLDVTGFTLPGLPFVVVGRNASVAWGFTNTGADVQDLRVEHLRGNGADTEFERPDGSWALAQHQIERIRVRGGRDLTLDVLTTTHDVGTASMQTPVITPLVAPLNPREHRALSLGWTIYDPSTVTFPLFSIDTASDAAALVASCATWGSVAQNLVYADARHIGYHMLGRVPVRGPAVQRPRAVQPLILPDRTPEEDEEDESGQQSAAPEPGSPAASSRWPHRVSADSAGPYHGARSQPSGAVLLPVVLRTRRRGARGAVSHTRAAKIPEITAQPTPAPLPQQPETPYTIGSPISPLPVDALDPTQVWSGYVPYSALPSVLDPASGVVATANARIAPDDFPYFLANDWVDPYRVERIHHLLEDRKDLTAADMLRMQSDVHSEFDLAVAQHLSYALDHASGALLAHDSRRLHQAADILRSWKGDLTTQSSAAAIVSVARAHLWPMLLAPAIERQMQTPAQSPGRAHSRKRVGTATPSPEMLAALYTWNEKSSALEELLEHTPARWLPRGYANWNDLLAACVEQSLQAARAPGDLTAWRYGEIHPIEIAHPVFGSHSFLSDLLGRDTGTGLQPDGGDSTTIKATGLHFGPSERFTADLGDPGATIANVTSGESGNPASPWYLDQFLPWLQGTSFSLPLDRPAIAHTLVLQPR